jgi:AraC family transcriptional regulator
MSRFHCARVGRGVAGETPARLRRRILLERAAYRLLTTGNGVPITDLGAGDPIRWVAEAA